MKSSVSIVKCQSYDEGKVLEGLRQAITLIGGIENFVKSGDHVLLKPNLLFGKPPEKAVTTHPSIVKGMIQIVREAGGVPFIGDSPSIGSLARAGREGRDQKSGRGKQCVLLRSLKIQSLLKIDTESSSNIIEIDRAVLEADVVINLPKWKTHNLMLLTLGVKNLFGCVPGAQKALWHLKAGEEPDFLPKFCSIYTCIIKPSLTVLDGIVGMEGNGPGSGDPIPLGLILASRDPLSLDQIGMRPIRNSEGISPYKSSGY